VWHRHWADPIEGDLHLPEPADSTGIPYARGRTDTADKKSAVSNEKPGTTAGRIANKIS